MFCNRRIKRQHITSPHRQHVVFENAEADFWTLKVLENGNWFTLLMTGRANPVDLLTPLIITTVAEIQTKAIDTGLHKLTNFILTHRCRTDSR